MQTNNENKIPEDEVDLRSIGQKIYSFFAYPVSLLFSKPLIALYFVIGAIVLSISLKYLVPHTYNASFILRPTDAKDKMYLRILSDIPVLLKKKDHAAIANLLGLDSTMVSNLKKIDVVFLAPRTAMDTTHCTEILMVSKDNTVFLPVQNAIVSYLENNPYYLKVKRLQKDQIQSNLNQINRDLDMLDSLKKYQLAGYEKQKGSTLNSMVLNELINPAAAYGASSERMTKKTILMGQSVFLDRFQLIKSCVMSSKHDWPPRILIMCFVLVPVSLLICVLFLHSRRRKLKE